MRLMFFQSCLLSIPALMLFASCLRQTRAQRPEPHAHAANSINTHSFGKIRGSESTRIRASRTHAPGRTANDYQ